MMSLRFRAALTMIGLGFVVSLHLLNVALGQQVFTSSLDKQLLDASEKGDPAAIQSLLQQGSHLEAKDYKGDTPLTLAASEGHTDATKLLLDRGANIERRGARGMTALIAAASRGRTDTVRLLLERGADPETQEAEDHPIGTALFWAATDATNFPIETVKLLLDREKHVDQALLQAAESPFVGAQLVGLLLDRGANIEVQDERGDTPLIIVALYGHDDKVEVLLDRGANIEARDRDGNTALMEASSDSSKLKTLKLLLDRGAYVDAKNKYGMTALEQAINTARFTHADLTEVVYIFKEYSNRPRTTPGTGAESERRKVLLSLTESLQQAPNDETLRKRILELAVHFDPRPAYSEQAQQHFRTAAALMLKKDPALTPQAVVEFQAAVTLAPWWPEAYYNLSAALELKGDYEGAIQQLQDYLLLKPTGSDAADAQAQIAALRAEKETAASAKEQHQRELALRYVSGEVQRFRVSDAPANWNPPTGIGSTELYSYTLPDEKPYFANIFRMPNERMLAVLLESSYTNCNPFCSYTGDGIVIVDVTHDPCSQGTFNKPFHYGDLARQTDLLCGYQYTVSVSNQADPLVSVTLAWIIHEISSQKRKDALKG